MRPMTEDTKKEQIKLVQIEPQYAWHCEAIIRGNRAGLKELAYALLAAADGDAATTDTVFVGADGEGYEIAIRRLERPDDYPQPFYTTLVQGRPA